MRGSISFPLFLINSPFSCRQTNDSSIVDFVPLLIGGEGAGFQSEEESKGELQAQGVREASDRPEKQASLRNKSAGKLK